ncbi:hypothetical protein RZA33_019765, partial [Halovibrio sp. HP20-59]
DAVTPKVEPAGLVEARLREVQVEIDLRVGIGGGVGELGEVAAELCVGDDRGSRRRHLPPLPLRVVAVSAAASGVTPAAV